MNYGDAFIAGLYTEAYFNNDIQKIIEKALLSIPAESDYAMAVLGVMKGLKALPAEYQAAVKAIGDSLFVLTDYLFNKAVEKTLEYAQKLTTQKVRMFAFLKLWFSRPGIRLVINTNFHFNSLLAMNK